MKRPLIEWTADENDRVARAFVESMVKDFHMPMSKRWPKLMDAAGMASNRIPNWVITNPAWTIIPNGIKKRILELWALRTAPQQPAPEPTPPSIIEVEREKAMDVAGFLRKVPTHELAAELYYREQERAERMERLVMAIAEAKPEASNGAKLAGEGFRSYVAHRAQPEVFKPKPKRVAIIGPLDSQFAEIERDVKAAGLDVELRFIDKEHHNKEIPVSCEFVVITRHTRHLWFDGARKQFGNDRVFFVDGPITSVIQKLRDISSRQ